MHKQAAWLQVPALNHQPPCFTMRLPPRALGAAQPPWLHCGNTQPSSPRQPSLSHPHPLLSGIYYCLSATMGQALCQEPGTQR